MMQTSLSPLMARSDLLTTDIPKVKILVLGEAGVGKTALAQSIRGRAAGSPSWTVGCSVDVFTHSFQAGSPTESLCLIELWDVGGSRSHRNSRHIFYQQADGLILVHDLSNRKSEDHLRSWLTELFSSRSSDHSVRRSPSAGRLPATVFDSQSRMASRPQIPVLVVGSKLDLAPARGRSQVAGECGADELTLDCRQPISAGSTNGLKLSRFFDRVIEKVSIGQTKEAGGGHVGGHVDRRRRLW